MIVSLHSDRDDCDRNYAPEIDSRVQTNARTWKDSQHPIHQGTVFFGKKKTGLKNEWKKMGRAVTIDNVS